MFEKEERSNLHIIRDVNFEATICMNPRDAMVFARITTLPENPEETRDILEQFKEYFYANYGGKSAIEMDLETPYETPLEEAYNSTLIGTIGNTKLAKLEDIDFQSIHTKLHLSDEDHLNKFETGAYTMLFSPHHYNGKYGNLFEFKKTHGRSFVTQGKINLGLYSEEAEEMKIENEHVRHFSIEENGEIIATAMVFIHDNSKTAYLSDYIIHDQKRNEGLGQALLCKAHEHLTRGERLPIEKIWYIAGGDGQSEIGRYLSDEIFMSKIMEETNQIEHRLFIRFGPPGPELTSAMYPNKSNQELNDIEFSAYPRLSPT